MALNLQNLMLSLNPTPGLDFSGGLQAMQQQEQMGAERQRLAMAREQFEETKKQHLQQMELQKTEEAGRNARTLLEGEQRRAEAEAVRQAALLKQQQEALLKFGELGGTGKTQQMAAMVPYLSQLGYDANSLGDVGGLPVYELKNRAQEAAKADQEWQHAPRPIDQLDGGQSATQSLAAMQGLGYPTDERGTLDEANSAMPVQPPGAAGGQVSFNPGGETDEATADALTPGEADLATAQEFSGGDGSADVTVGRGMVPASLSTGDAYAQALAASQYASESGVPRRGPDEEDYQGAVPRNVIDLPAMQAETMARLNPALKASAASLPTEELRKSATDIGQAVGGLGLEASDALTASQKAMDPALDIYKNQQAITAKNETRDALTPVQAQQLKTAGFKNAKLTYTTNKVGDSITAMEAADTVEDLMEKGGPRNHEKAVNFLMQMTQNKGPQTEADALRVIGGGQINSFDQLSDWLHKKVVGGFSEDLIASIKQFVEMERKRNEGVAYSWLDGANQQINSPDSHEQVRKGYKEFRDSVPGWLLKQYDEDRAEERKKNGGKAAESGPSGQTGGDIGAELDKQAKAAGLDAAAIRPLVATESGGNPKEKNHMGSSASGLFQFTDETAKRYGLKDAAEYANLPPDKQIEIGLRRFKDLGLDDKSSADDYAMANAAPGYINAKPGTVIAEYKSDTAFGKDVRAKNPGWIPADGGEITNDSIRAFYRRSRKGTDEKASADLPEPKTAAEKRIQELRAKAGG
jgi:hypothetical protein